MNVFTQDALAPMRMDNAFSFVRDFERLLGDAFFKKVKNFTSMRTDAGGGYSFVIAKPDTTSQYVVGVRFAGVGYLSRAVGPGRTPIGSRRTSKG
jgi:hypothetical protein